MQQLKGMKSFNLSMYVKEVPIISRIKVYIVCHLLLVLLWRSFQI